MKKGNGNQSGVWISISDTGTGIPENKKQKIFEPFYSTREEGLGLGLAIAHRIMEEHSGFVSLSSKVGEGAEFILTLPFIREKVTT
jgi:signal transduction histidine kinase